MDTKTLLIGAAGGAVVGGGVVGVGWFFSRRALKRENTQLRAALDGLGIPQAAPAQPEAAPAPAAPVAPQAAPQRVTVVTAQPVELTAEELAEVESAKANAAPPRSHKKAA